MTRQHLLTTARVYSLLGKGERPLRYHGAHLERKQIQCELNQAGRGEWQVISGSISHQSQDEKSVT